MGKEEKDEESCKKMKRGCKFGRISTTAKVEWRIWLSGPKNI